MNSNINNSNMTATQVGSVTRVSVGATAPQLSQSAPIYENNRVASGVTRFAMGVEGITSELVQSGVTRHNTYHDRNTSTVAATFQRVNGQDTVELVPGVPGSRTNVKTAINDGLIIPTGNGQYLDRGQGNNSNAAPAAPQAPTEAEPAAPVDYGLGVFDASEDEDWNAAIEPLPQHSYDSASSSITAAILSGSNNLERAANQLAESAAISPELAQQYVKEGYLMHEALVAREAAAQGVVDKQAFYSWMRNSKSNALHSAIQSLTVTRNVQPFRNLAIEFGRYSSQQAQAMRAR